MSFNKIRTQPTKHYWKKHKNFKNNAYHLHTASSICKKKFGMYKQKSWNVLAQMNAVKHEEATTCTWHS